MKNGFTLVELSIVLVIIGLLIGGVLVGQSLISAAKVNAQISQIQQFDASVAAFQSKYKQLPGDSKFHGGDGDGKIESFNAYSPFDGMMTCFGCEQGTFWNHLLPEQFAKAGTCNGTNNLITTGSGKTVPKPKIGHESTAIIAAAITIGSSYAIEENYFTITRIDNVWNNGNQHTRLATSANGNNSLKAIELASIDKKIDDGVANSGNVRAGGFYPAWGAPSLTEYTSCSSGGGVIK